MDTTFPREDLAIVEFPETGGRGVLMGGKLILTEDKKWAGQSAACL